MTAPDMSDICKQYIRCLLQGALRSAFQFLSQLPDQELFRALAVPAREDMEDLFDAEPEAPPGFAPEIPGVAGTTMSSYRSAVLSAAAMGGQVLNRISQMIYAYHVVKSGKLLFAKDAKAPTPVAEAWAKNYVHHCVALQEIPLDIDEDLTDSLPDPSGHPPAFTDTELAAAAKVLNVDVPAMKAVAQVESLGNGFGADGRPIIRFELHRFQSKTNRVFQKTHPHVSQTTLDGGRPYHNRTQAREYSLLYNAMLLNIKGNSCVEAAIESASWGTFQIMGENWAELGWSSALDFASDMYVSQANHLNAFVKFVQNKKGLAEALKKHQWATFARGFNGPAYAENNYDTNLEHAFNRLHKAQGTPAHP